MKRSLKWTGRVMLVIAILFAGFVWITPVFGWRTYAVQSGSMEPTLKVGEMIIIRPVRLEDITRGDIICFQKGVQQVAHRVVDIIEDEQGQIWFQTKGDANENPDLNSVSSESGKILKVVCHFPYLGFLASKMGLLILVGIPVVILIFISLKNIWKEIKFS